jgi:putative membrane protein
MQPRRYSNTDAVFYLIINLIRTVFYFDYKITKKNGSLLLWFVKYKSTILKPEVQIVTVTRNYFQRKMNILEIKQASRW